MRKEITLTATATATLADLPTYECCFDSQTAVAEVTQRLQQQPELPGAIAIDGSGIIGIFSRETWFELLAHLYTQAGSHPLALSLAEAIDLSPFAQRIAPSAPVFPATCSLERAIAVVLQRPQAVRYQPLVVEGLGAGGDRWQLIDVRDLLAARAQPMPAAPATNGGVSSRKEAIDLEALFAAMTDLIIVYDDRGTHLTIPPTNPALLYKTAEERLGKTLHDVFEPEQADTFLAYIQEVLATRRTLNVEYAMNIRRADVWLAATISPLSENSVMWIVRDITERKRAEQEVQLLLAVTQAIYAAPNFQAALAVVLEQVCQLTGWEYGEAWVPSTDGMVLECSPAWYWQPQGMAADRRDAFHQFREYTEGLTLLAREGLAGCVWATGWAEWVADVTAGDITCADADTNTNPVFLREGLAQHCGLRAAFGVPIAVEVDPIHASDSHRKTQVEQPARKVIAVLIFFALESHRRDRRLMELVCAVADRLGTAIQQKRQIAELRSLLGAMTDTIVTLDAQGQYLNVAPTQSAGVGLALAGKTLYDVYPRSRADAIVRHIWQALNTQEPVTFEYKQVAGDRDLWFASSIAPLSEDAVVWVSRDITDRRRAEEETKLLLTITQAIAAAPDFPSALEVALQQVCEATGWAYGEAWIESENGRYLECSPTWYCSRADKSPEAIAAVEAFRQHSEAQTFCPNEGIAGRVWWWGIPEWVPDVSVPANTTLFNAHRARQYGLKAAFGVPIVAKGEVKGDRPDLAPDLVPDLAPDRIQEEAAADAPGDRRPVVLAVLVFFMRESRQQDRRLVELVSAIAAQLGTVMQQKLAKLALAEKERYLRLILDNIPQQVFWKNTDLVFLGCNKNWAIAAGLEDPEAVVGKTDYDLLTDQETADFFREKDRQAIATNTPELHVTIRKQKPDPDGRTMWLDVNRIPIRDDCGNAIGVLGVLEDITQRKLAEEALHAERENSERLLLNILPQAIAERLKHDRSFIAEQFDEVTILFADIVGFTPLSCRYSPTALVRLLNEIFSRFDRLAERYGLEKIKTIGDAYMVAGGLPTPMPRHAQAIAHMALDMLDACQQFQPKDGEPFQIRIGIHTGPVVAGVIGIKKFSYDLWGDTVNVASRMESQGIPGKIQMTAATRDRLGNEFTFEERGAIAVKGKGETIAYWLTGRSDRA